MVAQPNLSHYFKILVYLFCGNTCKVAIFALSTCITYFTTVIYVSVWWSHGNRPNAEWWIRISRYQKFYNKRSSLHTIHTESTSSISLLFLLELFNFESKSLQPPKMLHPDTSWSNLCETISACPYYNNRSASDKALKRKIS